MYELLEFDNYDEILFIQENWTFYHSTTGYNPLPFISTKHVTRPWPSHDQSRSRSKCIGLWSPLIAGASDNTHETSYKHDFSASQMSNQSDRCSGEHTFRTNPTIISIETWIPSIECTYTHVYTILNAIWITNFQSLIAICRNRPKTLIHYCEDNSRE